MDELETRHTRALAFRKEGDAALASGDREGAYALYTTAHDLIMDCPRLHLAAHRSLRQVTRHHRDKREYWTDTFLIRLAPFGIFEAIAFAMRSTVWRAELCQRGMTSTA